MKPLGLKLSKKFPFLHYHTVLMHNIMQNNYYSNDVRSDVLLIYKIAKSELHLQLRRYKNDSTQSKLSSFEIAAFFYYPYTFDEKARQFQNKEVFFY